MRTPRELAVGEGKPIALAWIAHAVEALRETMRWELPTARVERWLGRQPKASVDGLEDRALVMAALRTNFSFPADPSPLLLRGMPILVSIVATFERAGGVIANSEALFFDVDDATATNLFPPGTPLPPAYALFDRGVYFTSAFAPWDPETRRGFGPLCRAAMVLHESIHVIDPVSGEAANHISEWDEPGFSAQTLEQSLHNPSAYASFAAQVHAGALAWPRDVRFGAGRPAD